MSNQSETIIINGSKEEISAINEVVKVLDNEEFQISKRKNLDGDFAHWIAIGTLSYKTIDLILKFIQGRLDAKQVKKIKIGNIEVINPTKEIVEQLIGDVKALRKNNKPDKK